MKRLNNQSAKTFSLLLAALQNKEVGKFTVPNQLLTITRDCEFPSQASNVFYCCVSCIKHDEGTVSDTCKMYFIVDDKRKAAADYGQLYIYPARYERRNTEETLDEESIIITEGVISAVVSTWQHGHVNQANKWLAELCKEGFFKKSTNKKAKSHD